MFGNDMFVRRKKYGFFLHFRTLGTFNVGGSLQAQRIPLSMNKPFPQNIAWREDAGNSTPSKGPLKKPRESEKTVQRNPF